MILFGGIIEGFAAGRAAELDVKNLAIVVDLRSSSSFLRRRKLLDGAREDVAMNQ